MEHTEEYYRRRSIVRWYVWAPLTAFGLWLCVLFAAQALNVQVYPPCPTEDSVNCYWDAATRGNGEGISFVNIDGVIHPR